MKYDAGWNKLALAGLLAMTTLTAACGTGRSSPVGVTCPNLTSYTREELAQAQDELSRVRSQGMVMIPRMMREQATTRAEIRACLGLPPGTTHYIPPRSNHVADGIGDTLTALLGVLMH